jgi:hypothetical protein
MADDVVGRGRSTFALSVIGLLSIEKVRGYLVR